MHLCLIKHLSLLLSLSLSLLKPQQHRTPTDIWGGGTIYQSPQRNGIKQKTKGKLNYTGYLFRSCRYIDSLDLCIA